jgi:hypothetical protein
MLNRQITLKEIRWSNPLLTTPDEKKSETCKFTGQSDQDKEI